MRKGLMMIALMGMAAAAAPASAQYYGGGHGGGDIRNQIERLDNRVERARYNGTISRREANRLDQQVDQLRYLAQRYGYNGYNRWERDDLQRRIYGVRQQLRYERRDDNGWRDGNYAGRDDWRYRDDRRWDRDDD